MFQAKKCCKNTYLKGMDEFLQAKLEADQTRAVGYGEKPTEESHQRCSHGAVARHTRSQSTEAGSSKKKTR